MNRPHNWTDTELEIVRRDYRGTRASAINLASRLSVTYWQVHYILEGMGLNHRWNERYWTAKEDKYLKNNYDRLSEKQLHRHLKRSKNSIHVRTTRLGLSRRNRDGWYTMKEVCEILGVDHHKVSRWIEQDILKASYHHGQKPQKSGSGYWHIDRADLAAFIRRYPQELIGKNVDLIQIVEILVGLDSCLQ